MLIDDARLDEDTDGLVKGITAVFRLFTYNLMFYLMF